MTKRRLIKEKHKDFLRKQQPETILPLTLMLTNMFQDENAEQLKQQNAYTLKNLSDAWAIANSNPGHISMERFYDNLERTLYFGTTERWAKAIEEGYRNRDDEGLMKVMKRVA